MNKKIRLAIVPFIVVILTVLIIYLVKKEKKEEVYIRHDMIVQQIEDLGNLEVVKYNIQDLMEYEKVRQWLPNSKASLKIAGEVIACVDLTKIQGDDIYTNKDSVSIILPIPEICHHKIDHSRSKVYNIEYGFWESANLVEEAYKSAEEHIYQEALNMGIAKESRENAIKALTPILRGLGFTKIHIGFKTAEETLNPEKDKIELIGPPKQHERFSDTFS